MTDQQQQIAPPPRKRLGDRWITIRQAAALVGDDMSPRRMRRRLKALAAQRPELGLIRRPGDRWFEVSAEALERALTTDPDLRETDIDALAARVQQVEDRATALRKRLIANEKRVRAMETRVEQLCMPGIG